MMKLLVLILFTLVFVNLSVIAVTSKVSYEVKDTLNRPVNDGRIRNWLSFELKSNELKKKNGLYGEGSFRYYHTREDFMFSVPELYGQLENKSGSRKLIVGRKIVDWNKYEGFWGLNNINPQRSYDLLDTKSEGLIGLHYDQKIYGGFKASFCMSFLYIPQTNPGLKVKDGKVTSSADWYVLPPSRIRLFGGKEKPTKYVVNEPKLKDIVDQKSFGGNLSYQNETLLFSSYFMFKPENKLRMNARGQEDLTDVGDDIVVVADPSVNYHGIFGALAGLKIGDVQNFLGVEVNDPNTRLGNSLKSIDPLNMKPEERKAKIDDFSIRPSYIPQTYLHFSTRIPKDVYNLSFNYIRLLSKQSISGDSFYNDSSRFKEAIGFGGSYFFTETLSTNLKWYYDLKRKDNIIKSEFGWDNKTFGIMVGAELLKSPTIESYWSDYRTNDSYYSKISIIF